MRGYACLCQVSKLRQEVEADARQLAEKYERRLREASEAMEARRKQETQEVEDRKNAHVQVLCYFVCHNPYPSNSVEDT